MLRSRPTVLIILCAVAFGLGGCAYMLLGLGSVLGGRDLDDPVTVSVQQRVALGGYDSVPYKSTVYLYFVSDSLRFMEVEPGEILEAAGTVPGGVLARKVWGSPGREVEVSLEPPGSEIYTEVGVLVLFREPVIWGRSVAEIPTNSRMVVEYLQDKPDSLTLKADRR